LEWEETGKGNEMERIRKLADLKAKRQAVENAIAALQRVKAEYERTETPRRPVVHRRGVRSKIISYTRIA
jgi:hypothetical protein